MQRVKQKTTALLVCLCLLGSLFAPFVWAEQPAADKGVTLMSGGAEVGEISVTPEKPAELSVQHSGASAAYQWQIMADISGEEMWVNISGETEAACTVTYPLVATILKNGQAKIRCEVTEGEAVQYSNAVIVKAIAEQPAPQENREGVTAASDSCTVAVRYLFADGSTAAVPHKMVCARGSALTATIVSPQIAGHRPVFENGEDAFAVVWSGATVAGDQTINVLYQTVAARPEPAMEPVPAPEQPQNEPPAPVVDVAGKLDEAAPPEELVTGNVPEAGSADAAENRTELSIAPAADAGLMATEEPGTKLEICTVTVRYVYTDGTPASDPYIATIEKATAFAVTVVSPEIFGFTPKFEDGTEAWQVRLSYDSVLDDQVVTVVYHSESVPYQVEHCVQKLINDSYTVLEIEKKNGPVGELTEAQAKVMQGFRAQPVKNIKIAADGSTVVQIYYDRLYYLVAFKLDGGHGTEPIYARYESPVSISKPARAGYEFQGWKKILQDEAGAFEKDEAGNFVAEGELTALPRTIPARNTGYLAVWEKVETTYTVIYMVQNPDDNDYSYYGYQHKSAATDETVSGTDDLASVEGVDKKEIAFFTYNDTLTEKDVRVKGDSSTVVRVYYDRNEYTLNFYFAKRTTDGKKWISTSTVWENGTKGGKYNEVMNTQASVNDTVWGNFVAGAATETGANGEIYYYIPLTARYGANIEDRWPALGRWPLTGGCDIGSYKFISWGVERDSGYWNSNTNKNIKGAYVHMDSQLIIDPATPKAQDLMAYYNTGPSDYVYEIYFQDLAGEYPATPSNSYQIRSTANGSQQTQLSFDGMEFNKKEYANGAGDNIKGGTIQYYYTRKTFKLDFFSHGLARSEELLYEAPLKGRSFVPEYPKDLPDNLYEFKGWYSSAEHLPGTEYDFETGKMPAGNLSLYALWSPKSFDVRIFQTATLETQIGETITAAFGEKLERPETPDFSVPGVEITFVGWFYMSNGEEKAVDFEEFMVQGDVDIYAKWFSSIDVPFKVKYELEDGTPVADPLTGYAKGGENRTFQAKTGNLLYKTYQQGYYPVVSSHTILMNAESGLEYTFIYKNLDTTSYTVRYLDRETRQPLFDDKVVADNRLAIVVEQYEYKEGYVPDAFAKRLTVTTDPDQNVITFWYRKAVDQNIAPYTITHYLQDPNDPGQYFLYQYRNVQLVAGAEYLVSTLELEGYTFQFDQFQVKNYDDEIPAAQVERVDGGVQVRLPEKGAKIDLYYNCRPTVYTVKHVDYETKAPIVDVETRDSLVGATITAEGLTQERLSELGKSHYSVYGAAAQTRVLAEIKESETGVNEFVFYYMEKEIDYHYVPVVQPSGYTDFGAVSLASETVKVQTGTAGGAVPVEQGSFRFEGWYLDEACTKLVRESTLYAGYIQPDSDALVPQKNENGVYDDSEAQNGQIIFYALFKPSTADLVITKSGADDENQVFVYRITGSYGMDMEVTIVGNGEVTVRDLPRGSYTVTEDNGWSWRYSDGKATSVALPNHGAEGGGSTAGFGTSVTGLYWLDGHSKLAKNKTGTADITP